MKKIYPLSDRQRDYAGEHVGIVYSFLHRNFLPVDDYYDIVIFGYLAAVQQYDEDRRLQSRYSFSTIAWRQMQFSVYDYYRSCSRQKRKALVFSLDCEMSDPLQAIDLLLPGIKRNVHESAIEKFHTLEMMSCLTEKEQEIVKLKACGYTYREIADQCGLTEKSVTGRFFRLRKRLKALAFA